MKLQKAKIFPLVCLLLGGVLILGALGILLYTGVSSDISKKNMQEILQKTEAKLPVVTDLIPEERGNNTMPAMELDGVNVVGLLTVPQFGVKLPIHASWNVKAVSWIPCRFSGSIYDRTLIIGAGAEQFHCAETIQLGDAIYVTDMEGGRYRYVVSDIDRSSNAHRETLESAQADLTVFVKNSRSMEYILIRCNVYGSK